MVQTKFPRSSESSREERERRLDAAGELAASVGVEPACEALSVSRGTFYRRQVARRLTAPITTPDKHPALPRTLSAEERHTVLETPNSP